MFSKEFMVLDKIIKNGKYENKFAVFSNEASSGKTQQIIKSVAEAPSHKQFLIVTKFIDEVVRIVTGINDIKGKEIARGLISNADKIKNSSLVVSDKCFNLFTDQIIVITHSTYINLCNNKKPYLAETVKNFDTLIIDEELNPVKYTIKAFKYSDFIKVYSNIKSYSREIAEEFYLICKYLNEEMKNKDKYKIGNQYLFIDKYDNNIEDLCDIIDGFISSVKKHEINFNVKMNDDKISFSMCELIDFLELVKCIYISLEKGIGLIHTGYKEIVTYNYEFKYFMLKNNILLDASARFNTLYKSEMFEVFKTERKISHEKCNAIIISEKTTTSAKNSKLVEFRSLLSDYVITAIGKYGKGLIATKKAEAIYLNNNEFSDIETKYDKRISVCNYENQRGRNDFADYNHVFLAHTYRMPTPYYVFLHMFYFKDIELKNNDIVTGKIAIKECWGFKNNKKLQELMFTDMVSSQYQTLKRIQRNQSPHAYYHFFTTEYLVVTATLKELYGFNMNNITIIEDFCGNEKKTTKKDELITHIQESINSNGKWIRCKSDDLKKKLNINKNKWIEIWNDKDFLDFCKKNRIKEGNIKGQKGNWVIKY